MFNKAVSNVAVPEVTSAACEADKSEYVSSAITGMFLSPVKDL